MVTLNFDELWCGKRVEPWCALPERFIFQYCSRFVSLSVLCNIFFAICVAYIAQVISASAMTRHGRPWIIGRDKNCLNFNVNADFHIGFTYRLRHVPFSDGLMDLLSGPFEEADVTMAHCGGGLQRDRHQIGEGTWRSITSFGAASVLEAATVRRHCSLFWCLLVTLRPSDLSDHYVKEVPIHLYSTTV